MTDITKIPQSRQAVTRSPADQERIERLSAIRQQARDGAEDRFQRADWDEPNSADRPAIADEQFTGPGIGWSTPSRPAAFRPYEPKLLRAGLLALAGIGVYYGIYRMLQFVGWPS